MVFYRLICFSIALMFFDTLVIFFDGFRPILIHVEIVSMKPNTPVYFTFAKNNERMKHTYIYEKWRQYANLPNSLAPVHRVLETHAKIKVEKNTH